MYLFTTQKIIIIHKCITLKYKYIHKNEIEQKPDSFTHTQLYTIEHIESTNFLKSDNDKPQMNDNTIQ